MRLTGEAQLETAAANRDLHTGSEQRSQTMSKPTQSRRGHRLWIPVAVIACTLGGLLVADRVPELERNFKSWLISGILALALTLLVLWFALLSRVPWRKRLLALTLVGLAAFGLSKAVRVEGTTDGRGLPRLVWRWSEKPERRFAGIPGTNSAPLPKAVVAGVEDVPQFFGPDRNGTVRGANLARDWSTQPPRELWRQSVGEGWSAFAVAGNRAFTQEQRGAAELVTCYELLTGRLLWAHTNLVRFTEWQGGDGPRATPTVDRGRVLAIGGTGVLNCLEADSGESIWSRDVLGENQLPNLTWGIAGSPLVFDDVVVVTGGFTNGPTLFAYERGTGRPLWSAGTDKSGYSSPALTTLAGRRVVLSVNASSLTAHEPDTGRLLLNHPWAKDNWPKASQPVVLPDDRVFISAGYGMGCEMLKIAAGAGGQLAAEVLWKNKMMKTQFNSAGFHDGFLYGLDDGLLACVDATTGERKWKDGRYGSGQTLLVDDLVLVQAERGFVALVAAKPDGFEELARLDALSGKTWNHPTLAGRYLLVRNSLEAACYELPVAPR